MSSRIKNELKIIFVFGLFVFLFFGLCLSIGTLFSWYFPLGLISFFYWYSVQEASPSPEQIKSRKNIFVVIIGAGFSGLCAAIKLKRERIRFVLIEKSENIGGTWWDNKYPGCACDIWSHLYSLSFKPNPFWSKTYPHQEEILDYLEDTFDYYGIREHVELGTKVDSCVFNATSKKWTVVTSKGAKIECNFIISGIGALHTPKFPEIIGKEEFKGESFHTAQWKKGFDWFNKKVAIIGTGCTAIQVIPKIFSKCKQLYVFQRTPSWVTPKLDIHYPYILQKCFQLFPLLMKIHRWYIFFRQELLYQLVFTKESELAKLFKSDIALSMTSEINSKELQKKLIPNYAMGCKRITVSHDYLSAFNQPNVELITKPIRKISQTSIHVQDSESKEVDAIIYATGFDILGPVKAIDIHRPVDGECLSEIWGNFPTAYLGIMQPQFPNVFILLGPGTGLG